METIKYQLSTAVFGFVGTNSFQRGEFPLACQQRIMQIKWNFSEKLTYFNCIL